MEQKFAVGGESLRQGAWTSTSEWRAQLRRLLESTGLQAPGARRQSSAIADRGKRICETRI